MVVMQLAALAGALILGCGAITLAFIVGWRAKSRIVLDPLIRLQRSFINPQQMRSAGAPGASASVIRHRGRVSGRAYETPVGAVATDGGFVIALPYGSRTHWLRNVLAQESAAIVHEGHTYAVDRPEIVPMQAVEAHFTPADRRSFRLFGTDQALRVRWIEPGRAGERSRAATDGEGWRSVAVDATQSIGARHVA